MNDGEAGPFACNRNDGQTLPRRNPNVHLPGYPVVLIIQMGGRLSVRRSGWRRLIVGLRERNKIDGLIMHYRRPATTTTGMGIGHELLGTQWKHGGFAWGYLPITFESEHGFRVVPPSSCIGVKSFASHHVTMDSAIAGDVPRSSSRFQTTNSFNSQWIEGLRGWRSDLPHVGCSKWTIRLHQDSLFVLRPDQTVNFG